MAPCRGSRPRASRGSTPTSSLGLGMGVHSWLPLKPRRPRRPEWKMCWPRVTRQPRQTGPCPHRQCRRLSRDSGAGALGHLCCLWPGPAVLSHCGSRDAAEQVAHWCSEVSIHGRLAEAVEAGGGGRGDEWGAGARPLSTLTSTVSTVRDPCPEDSLTTPRDAAWTRHTFPSCPLPSLATSAPPEAGGGGHSSAPEAL